MQPKTFKEEEGDLRNSIAISSPPFAVKLTRQPRSVLVLEINLQVKQLESLVTDMASVPNFVSSITKQQLHKPLTKIELKTFRSQCY